MVKEDMRILISNDDGIAAQGLKVLEAIAKELSDDVWVVAPEREHSGAGHSLTLMRPLRVRKLSERHFAVDGTPTDCMQVALKELLSDKKPDLMLSGVNHGANLGEDVTYSGTVAAAMEATILGVPSIAISQQVKSKEPVKWSTAQHWCPRLIETLITHPWPKGVMLNVNVPNVLKGAVKGPVVVKQGNRHEKGEITQWYDPRGEPFYWLASSTRGEETDDKDNDLHMITQGHITITPLNLDLTNYNLLGQLSQLFKGEADPLHD